MIDIVVSSDNTFSMGSFYGMTHPLPVIYCLRNIMQYRIYTKYRWAVFLYAFIWAAASHDDSDNTSLFLYCSFHFLINYINIHGFNQAESPERKRQKESPE